MSNGKTVLVTGGTNGIGRAVVDKFLSEGWNVATCGRNAGIIEGMTSKYDMDSFMGIAADLRLDNHVSALFEEMAKRFGGLDVCILNAGTLGPAPLPPVSKTDLMDLRKTFEMNVFANFNVMKRAIELLKSPGMIVHLTSDAAVQPYPGWGAYGSSKAAMRQLVEILREESNGTPLKVLNFDPGDVDTDMHSLAVPDADRSELRQREDVADELFNIVRKEMV